MGQLVLGAVGAVIGSYFGSPQIGWAIGAAIGGAVFAPKTSVKGPQISDLRVNGLEYGQTIPYVRGAPTLSGQIWWASDRREIATTTTVGKGGPETDQTTFTYEVDLLVGFTYNEMAGLAQIIMDGKLEYSVIGGLDSAINSGRSPKWRRLTFYPGDFTQLPDPTYEAAIGVGRSPAYRGRCYLFFESLQLGGSGRIPNITARLFSKGTDAEPIWRDHTSSLAPYSVETGTAAGFSIVNTSFGTGIKNEARASGTADLLSRPIPPIFVRYFECKFAIDSGQIGLDDGGVIGIYTSTDAGVIVFNPIREVAEDPLRRPQFNSHPVGAALPYDAMMLCQVFVDPLSGAPATAIITNLETGEVLVNELFPYTNQTIAGEKQKIFNDTTLFDNTTTGVVIGEILIVGELASIEDETLEDVVTSLCERSGMSSGQFDASQLSAITKPVRAMAVSQIVSTRQVLEYLASCWFFESYTTNQQVFVPRGGAAVATLEFEDLGATESADAANDAFDMLMGSELELPAVTAISYMNIDTDCSRDSQFADRQNTDVVTTTVTEVPFGFTAEEAKQIVDAWLLDQRVARFTSSIALLMQDSTKYVPTDVFFIVDEQANQFRMRAVRRRESGATIGFELVLDDASVLDQLGITSADYSSPTTVSGATRTIMLVLDIPILRDIDNATGIYVVEHGASAPWPGGAVIKSPDDVTYERVATVTESAIFGTTVDALPDWTSGNEADERDSVEVRLTGVGGSLSSVSHDVMLTSDANGALIGDEVIQFRSATFTSDDTYILTGLLRGRRGTDWAMIGHIAGERFVFLQTSGMRRVPMTVSEIAATQYWRGVTLGQLNTSAPVQAIEFRNVGLLPFSPVDFRATRFAADHTSLLLHFNGAAASTTFTDSSGTPHVMTANGNVQISTAQSMFGGASGLFDGAGDFLTTPHRSDLDVPTGDFAFDIRVRFVALTDAWLVNKSTASAIYPYALGLLGTPKKFQFNGFTLSSFQAVNLTSTTVPVANQWYRVGCQREGSTFRLLVDGVIEATSTSSATLASIPADPLCLGATTAGVAPLNGYLDEFIFVKGTIDLPGDGSTAFPDTPGGDGTVTVSFSRRTRLDTNFNESIVPLGEASEEYEVDIYSDNTYTTVVRTFSGLTSAEFTYTAAQQVVDFGSTQGTIYLKAYQMSEIMGRGYAGTIAI